MTNGVLAPLEQDLGGHALEEPNPTTRLEGAVYAELLGTALVVGNLGLRGLDATAYESTVVVNRSGKDDQDQVEVVLEAIHDRQASRLVSSLRRGTAVGKAPMGSIGQPLLPRSPVPALAVKLDDED